MSKIVSIHSFRRGTGKSILTTNFAALLASAGQQVVVIDTNLESPSLHILCGLQETEITYTLNDYLWGNCSSIQQTLHDVTAQVGGNISGRLWLIPASSDFHDIKRFLIEGYDAGKLNYGYYELMDKLQVDALLIDTHAGLHAEALSSIAIANILTIILRMDRQDYQGTGVLVDLANHIDLPPRRILVANEVPLTFDFEAVKTDLAKTFDCDVIAVLPHSKELMAVASNYIFALHHPEHPLSLTLSQAAAKLVG